MTIIKIRISSKSEQLREIVLSAGKAIVEMDSLDNDYTHTCSIGDIIMVEPGRPPISATKRYMVWYKNMLIYCKIKLMKDPSKWNILGIGEVNVSDIHFWCNAKKM
jgi:ribosomal protein S17